MENKFLDKIKKNFYNTFPQLSESSRKIVIRNLLLLYKKINGDENLKSLNFIYNKNKVIDSIKDLNYLTQRNYYHMLNYIIKSNLKSEKSKKILEFYLEKREALNNQYNSVVANNEMSEKTQKNWITMEEYDKILSRIKLVIDSFDYDDIRPKEITLFQKYLILNIYKYHPMRLDLHDMKIIDEKDDKDLSDDFNYMIKLDNGNFRFKILNFKTKKTHKEIIIDINPKLNDIINKYLKINKSEFFITQERNPNIPIKKQALANYISRIFKKYTGKDIGVNMIRKLVVSDRFADIDKAQKKLAKEMGHNHKTQQNYLKYSDENLSY